MKVKEMMEKLKKVDPEMEVSIDYYDMPFKARSLFIQNGELCISPMSDSYLDEAWEKL